MITQRTDGNGTSYTNTKFINNHIIVLNFDKEGNANHASIIPKKFTASKSGYPQRNKKMESATDFMFFTKFKTEQNLFFLYNDETNFERKIVDPDRYKVLNRFNEAVTVLTCFDEEGKLKRKQLFNTYKTRTFLMPKYSIQINEDQIFFFNKKSKLFMKEDFRFGIMTIENKNKTDN